MGGERRANLPAAASHAGIHHLEEQTMSGRSEGQSALPGWSAGDAGDRGRLELGEGSGKLARISYEQSAYGGGAPVMRVVLP